MNERLSLMDRLKLRMHIMMCKNCANYKQNLETIEEGLTVLKKDGFKGFKLPDDRKLLIKSKLISK